MRLRKAARDVRTISALMKAAEAEARTEGVETSGEHLVLAALDLDEGSARRAFERVGHTRDDYRRAIARHHADALRAIGIDVGDETALAPGPSEVGKGKGLYRTTANARTLFNAVSELARADRDAPLSGAHVIRALSDLEHGTAARALDKLGVDRAELAEAAEAELDTIRARRR